MEHFATRLMVAMENAVVKAIEAGGVVALDFHDRIRVDSSTLREIYSKINLQRVIDLVVVKAEERMADAIHNNMSHEISADVKKILANTELREDLRAMIRAEIRFAANALGKEKKTV